MARMNENAPVSRRRVLFGVGAAAALAALPGAVRAAGTEVVVYKDPYCGCCGNWADHLRANGFSVTVREVADMAAIKRRAGIPEALESCHTATVAGYLVEGHVPASDIRRMLAEQPAIRGLSAPGMPASAPGMDIPGEPYAVYAFDARGGVSLYASH